MEIPENITKEHLIKAIKKIDDEGIPNNGNSSTYDVIYEGKPYPPKLVVSYGNLFANEEELDRKSFEGGWDTECFEILRDNGFVIEPKNFYKTLIKFLNQAQTSDQRTNDYPKSYKGLKVNVSFGKGNAARIPWIAFLSNSQKVNNGIYPVYLYYKKEEILILAYGLSETVKPQDEWTLNADIKTIKNFYKENYNIKPDRYGESFVFKVYEIKRDLPSFGLIEHYINSDINSLVNKYKKLPFNSNSSLNRTHTTFDFNAFQSHIDLANLRFTENLIIRFISALCTKPFVILTGLAGSGKTKLAQAFSEWICEDEKQICLVAVGADWTNRDPLLGYPNALEKESYVKPESGVLDLLIRAGQPENADKPHFLILDEMNLSHVERYFADFLSAMESGKGISIHNGGNISESEVPSKISLPKNLFIIGTVNVDETTYMFSPKVLDRASVIEFKVSQEEMEIFLSNPSKADLGKMKSLGVNMAGDFLAKASSTITDFSKAENLNKVLLEFFRELKKAGAEFGYRTATEINRFAGIIDTLEINWEPEEIIDAAVMQKLLPKIHGSRRKIEPTLKILATLCLIERDNKEVIEKALNDQNFNFKDTNQVKFPISLEKIGRMYRGALQDGFTSFAEA